MNYTTPTCANLTSDSYCLFLDKTNFGFVYDPKLIDVAVHGGTAQQRDYVVHKIESRLSFFFNEVDK